MGVDMDTWGNYGTPDRVFHLCGFTWRYDPPTDEGFSVPPLTETGRAILKARAAQQSNPSRVHDVQLSAFACLSCGREDGRTRAAGLLCHDCTEDGNIPLTGV